MATQTTQPQQPSQEAPQPSVKELAAQALKAQGLEEGGRLYFTQRLAGPSASARLGYAFYLPQKGLIVNVTHLIGDLLGHKPKAIGGEGKSRLFVISTLKGAELVSLASEAVWPDSPQSRLFAVNL